MAANAVMGYSAVDYLFLNKNITSDIAQYLEEPDMFEGSDVAVPYDTPETERNSDEGNVIAKED